MLSDKGRKDDGVKIKPDVFGKTLSEEDPPWMSEAIVKINHTSPHINAVHHYL